MYQKDLIRSMWKAAGLYDENDSKLQQFLKMLDDPTQCWTGMVDAARRSFSAYKQKLAQPILNGSDKLAHLMLIRAATPANDDEMKIVEQYIASSDPVRDEAELKAIALKNVPGLNEALKKKPNLTTEVRQTIAAHAAIAVAPVTPGIPLSPAAPPAPVAPAAPVARARKTKKPPR